LPGFLNVDAYGKPDYAWDLEEFPYPWEDNSADEIVMNHVLEHIQPWWEAFNECVRILKPGGCLYINVPDASSDSAMTYRDHHHVFSPLSFHGIVGYSSGTNTWAESIEHSVPVVMEDYRQVPFKQYNWMIRVPRLMVFCAKHMRNFVWEQRFTFRKIGEENE
jgi:ubiquinone/menaquinone biosynthesis C-methylase UbiE